MGTYTYGPVTEFSKILAAVQSGGTAPSTQYNLQNAFNIGERIWAGYAMNTISLGKLRLQTGVRIESTQDSLLANKIDATTDPITVTPLRQNNSYTNVFPSGAGAVPVRFGYRVARLVWDGHCASQLR
jgi:hypothetical protein